MVEEVLDQWYGPQDAFYKVRADDGAVSPFNLSSGSPGWTYTSLHYVKDWSDGVHPSIRWVVPFASFHVIFALRLRGRQQH